MADLTVAQLRAFQPTIADPDTWARQIDSAATRFEITAPVRLAAFLAQIAHESAGFTHLVENLNYRAETLVKTWPHRFPTIESAQPYAHNPQKLANKVYGGRLGNGDEASGDGWTYRGRGLIQLTGRDTYRDAGVALGLQLEASPGEVTEPEIAALTAAQYWHSRGLNGLADIGSPESFDLISRRINGGIAGLVERRALWAKAKAALAA